MNSCEQCWILQGDNKDGILWWAQPHNQTEGMPASVDFDPKYVLEQEEATGAIVGFLHTHPGMMAHYSGRDDRTMKAWVACFGKPLVCCIFGTDGLRAWWFVDDENDPIEMDVQMVNGVIFGIYPDVEEYKEYYSKANAEPCI